MSYTSAMIKDTLKRIEAKVDQLLEQQANNQTVENFGERMKRLKAEKKTE